jgi:hypothetical protein
MEDIPKFDRETASAEVSKFMLDQEAINYYIAYEKKRAEDPDFDKPKEEGLFSFQNAIYAYLVYVVGSTVALPQLRNYLATQQAAGAWQGTNIPFIDDWVSTAAVQASSSGVAETVQAVGDGLAQ